LTKQKRAKNEPTKGDLLAQAYRNRAAMFRVHQSVMNQKTGHTFLDYWTPTNIDELNDVRWGVNHGA